MSGNYSGRSREKLHRFVRRALQEGYSLNKIEQMLLEQGWKTELIRKAIVYEYDRIFRSDYLHKHTTLTLLFVLAVGIIGLFAWISPSITGAFMANGYEWENKAEITASSAVQFIEYDITFGTSKPANCAEGIYVITSDSKEVKFGTFNETYVDGLCTETGIRFENLIYDEKQEETSPITAFAAAEGNATEITYIIYYGKILAQEGISVPESIPAEGNVTPEINETLPEGNETLPENISAPAVLLEPIVFDQQTYAYPPGVEFTATVKVKNPLNKSVTLTLAPGFDTRLHLKEVNENVKPRGELSASSSAEKKNLNENFEIKSLPEYQQLSENLKLPESAGDELAASSKSAGSAQIYTTPAWTENFAANEEKEFTISLKMPESQGKGELWFYALGDGVSEAVDPWWNNNWTYRQNITITENSGSNLINFQVNLTINTTALIAAGKMNISCGDIRFVNSTNSQINYWIESGCNTTSLTAIWVKIPNIPASGTENISMYYGNPLATNGSNGTLTFDFFDDFEDAVNSWTVQAGTWAESGGVLSQTENLGGTPEAAIRRNASASNNSAWVLQGKLEFTNSISEFAAISIHPITSGFDTDGHPNNRTGIFVGTWSGTKVTYGTPGATTDIAKTVDTDTWYEIKIQRNGNNYDFWWRTYPDAWDYLGQKTDSNVYSWNEIVPEVDWRQDYASFDNIFMYKYATTVPSFTMGNEETNSIATTLVVNPNSSSVASGSSLTINARYADDASSPVSTANCIISITLGSASAGPYNMSYNSGSGNFTYFYTTNRLGNYSATVTCNASGYMGRSASTSFAVTGNWWDTNWLYRQNFTIINNAATALTNFQVNLTIDTASLISAGKMNGSCNDIRFVNSTNSEIDYWIEYGCNNVSTHLWVEVPNIPASGTENISMYYGNLSAATASNISKTFLFGDDFDDNSLDWTVQVGTWNERNGYVNSTGACTGTPHLALKKSVGPLPLNWTIQFVLRADTSSVKESFAGVIHPAADGFAADGHPNTRTTIYFGTWTGTKITWGVPSDTTDTSTAPSGNTWYEGLIDKANTTYTFKYRQYPSGSWTTLGTKSYAGLTWDEFVFVADYRQCNISVSQVFIRQRASVDPTYTNYSEEKVPIPDLKPTAINYAPLGLITGDAATINATIVNQGHANTSAFNVSLYIDDVFYAQNRILSLNASSTNTTSFSWTATSGLHDFKVVADSAGQVTESSEANNNKVRTIGVDWPTLQQSVDRNSYANLAGPITGNVIWDRTWVGSVGQASVAIVNNTVYAGGGDDAGYNFYALNLTNGSIICNYSSTGRLDVSSPTFYKGVIYVGSGDNNVYALNATNCAKIWDYATGGIMYSSPALSDNVLYIGSSDYKVYALNATNGSLKWQYLTGSGVYSSPAVADGVVYIGSDDYQLYALDAVTGSKLWNYSVANTFDAGSASILNGRVYASPRSAKIVYALNATNGTRIWNYTTGDDDSISGYAPAIADGVIYFGSGNNNIYALNATNGTKIWNTSQEQDIFYAPAVANNKILYSTASSNHIYALNATNGGSVWTHAWTGGGQFEAPALVRLPDGRSVVVANGPQGIVVLGELADIKPTAINYAPLGLVTGDSATINATIVNQGTFNASAFNVSLYIGGVFYAQNRILSLNASRSVTTSFSWTAISGLHDFKVVADSASQISESDETNNNKVRTIGVDWPTLQQGVDHNSYANLAGPVMNKTLWSISASMGLDASVAIVNNIIYAGATVDSNGTVFAINLSTGQYICNYTGTDNTNFRYSTPAVYKGIVYAGSTYDDNVYALNATNCSKIWNFTIKGDSSSITLSDNKLYVGSSDNNVYALNATNGTKIWNYTTGGDVESTPAIADEVVYVGSDDVQMYALDAITGSKIWNFTSSSSFYKSSASIYGGIAYFSTNNGQQLYALNATDGTKIWNYSVANVGKNAPAILDNVVYFDSSYPNIYALNATNGTKSWNLSLSGANHVEAPVLANNKMLYASSGSSNFYAINITSKSVLWDSGGPNQGTTPALARLPDGRGVVVVSAPGSIVAIVGNTPPNPPTPYYPGNNSLVITRTPTLNWTIPADIDNNTLHFHLQIANDSAFAQVVVNASSSASTTGFVPTPPVAQNSGNASYAVQSNLEFRQYFWKVRAWDGSDYGNWSNVFTFNITTVTTCGPNSFIIDFGDVGALAPIVNATLNYAATGNGTVYNITSAGNVNMNVTHSGTNLTSGAYRVSVASIGWKSASTADNSTLTYANKIALQETADTVNKVAVSLPPNNLTYLRYWLTATSSQPPGFYNGTYAANCVAAS